jgi:glycosyltransferase involved in cell wall biosynthesis/predicted SAM-dependent methyltransferase
MPRVSVFIPSYNHADYIGAAIKSVLAQSFQDFEIVVTDDGSTDGTPDIIAAFDDPRIKLKRFPENRGAALATNDAIHRCSGEFLALLNSDDVFLPHKLERQVGFLDAHPDIGAVFGFPQFIDKDGIPLDAPGTFNPGVFAVENRSRIEWLRHLFLKGNCLCHPTIMIRRECYERVGAYDARFATLPDFQMWMRLLFRYQIHVLPEMLIGFRELPNAANASAMRLDSYLRMVWEHARVRACYVQMPQDLFEAVFAPEIASLQLDPRQDRSLTLGRICVATDNPTLHRLGLDLLFDGLPASPEGSDPRNGFGHPDFHHQTGEKDIFNMLQELRSRQMETELHQVRQAKAAAAVPVENAPLSSAWVVPVLDKLKINLGCGPTIIPGWINLDREPKEDAHFWDATLGIPSEANSISLVYSEHFIEHLSLEEGTKLLSECVRVLCPGGVMRLSTPDLRVLIQAYEGSALDYWLDVGWRPRTVCDLVNEGMRAWGHQYLFDRARLTELLLQAGFASVAAVPWGLSSVPELCGREARPFHGELIFEAQKGPG